MEELQSLLQAACCHVLSMPWVQMDGPFPISSPWVLTALAPHPQQHSGGGLPDGTGSTAIRSDIFFFPSREKSLPCPVRGSPLTKLYFKTVSGRVSERLSTGVAGFLHGLAASWLGGIVLCWRATVSDCVNQPWLCLSRQWPVKTS